MKFLLDAQLPIRLSYFLVKCGYDSIHTLNLPNKNATKDKEINQISIKEKIIEYLQENRLVEITDKNIVAHY